jgi:hypothetical protein
MNKSTSVLVALGLFLAGCGEKSTSTSQSPSQSPAPAGATNADSSGNPLNAPADYLSGLAKGHQNAMKTVDTTSLDKAIQLFNVDQGRNPKDLQELVAKKYIPKIPDTPFGTKLVYDAGAGEVKIVKQ